MPAGKEIALRSLVFLARKMPDFPRVFGRFADRVNSTRDFVIAHRRLPGRPGHLTDYFHALINSDEILNPIRAYVADKEHAKSFVTAIVGPEHAVPTLSVLRSVDEAVTYSYPDRCVIKPTHLSGEVILTRSEQDIDLAAIRSWFDVNWYHRNGGWEIQYRDLIPKVIVEPLLFGDDDISDIKLFCSHGRVGMVQVDIGRRYDHRRALFTPTWERLPFGLGYKQPSDKDPRLAKPGNLHELIAIAEALSADFSFIRVDLYSDGKSALVGELTSCPDGAVKRFHPNPAEADKMAFDLVFGAPSTV